MKTTSSGVSNCTRHLSYPVPFQDSADHVIHFLFRQLGEHRQRDTAGGVTFGVGNGAGNSGLFQMLVGKMLESGDLSGLKFTLSNAAKDLRYYTHFTESMMLPSTIGEAVHQSLVTANALGFGDKYVASLIEAQEKLAGVAIVPR